MPTTKIYNHTTREAWITCYNMPGELIVDAGSVMPGEWLAWDNFVPLSYYKLRCQWPAAEPTVDIWTGTYCQSGTVPYLISDDSSSFHPYWMYPYWDVFNSIPAAETKSVHVTIYEHTGTRGAIICSGDVQPGDYQGRLQSQEFKANEFLELRAEGVHNGTPYDISLVTPFDANGVQAAAYVTTDASGNPIWATGYPPAVTAKGGDLPASKPRTKQRV